MPGYHTTQLYDVGEVILVARVTIAGMRLKQIVTRRQLKRLSTDIGFRVSPPSCRLECRQLQLSKGQPLTMHAQLHISAAVPYGAPTSTSRHLYCLVCMSSVKCLYVQQALPRSAILHLTVPISLERSMEGRSSSSTNQHRTVIGSKLVQAY